MYIKIHKKELEEINYKGPLDWCARHTLFKEIFGEKPVSKQNYRRFLFFYGSPYSKDLGGHIAQ